MCDVRGVAFAGQSDVEESPDSKKKRCRVTPGRGNPTESATEMKPPLRSGLPDQPRGKGETVG